MSKAIFEKFCKEKIMTSEKVTMDDLVVLYKYYETKENLEYNFKVNKETIANTKKEYAWMPVQAIFGVFVIFIFFLLAVFVDAVIIGLLNAGQTAMNISGYILMIIALVLAFLVLKSGFSSKNKKRSENIEKNLTAQNAEIQKQYRQLPDLRNLIQLLPDDFRNSSAISILYNTVYQSEADSIKEGIRVVRDKWFRAQQLKVSQQALNDQQITNQRMVQQQQRANDLQDSQLSKLGEINKKMEQINGQLNNRRYY